MLHVVASFMPHVFACCIFHAARFCMLQVERALHAETHGDLSATALVHCAAQEFVEVDIGALSAAARRPAPPAPTTTASNVWSMMGYD